MSVHDRPCGCRVSPWPQHVADRLCQYHEGWQDAADAISERIGIKIEILPVPEQGDLTEGNQP